jgi:nitrite reductase/ring-hydroxylating ferredoxin subunit
MRRSEYLNVAERLLAHVEAGTTDSADRVKHIPVERYLDPTRWQIEMDAIFRRLPLILAFTAELRIAGDYKMIEVIGVPVLIVRGEDAVARAFIGTCTHRGTTLVGEGTGNCDRFTCPYHAWTYDSRGALVGVAGKQKFGEFDAASRGLIELPCAERAGLIFVCLSAGAEIDIESYLGGMLPELESFGFENWYIHHQNEMATSNWKVAHDGYLEGYHFATLHPRTIAAQIMTNIMTYDAYGPLASGPHQRVCFPAHSIAELRGKPNSEWRTEEGVAVVRTIFPNVSFAVSVRGGGLISQMFPGPTPDSSRTIQNHVFPHPPASDAERAQMDASVALFIGAVENEDNWVCAKIQRGLAGGGNKDFIFGRNELGLHRLHDSIEHYVGVFQGSEKGRSAPRAVNRPKIPDKAGGRERRALMSGERK